MTASTFINYRSENEIYNQIVEYLSKGYVTVDIEKVTFVQGTSEYSLNNSNIIRIISIEGMRDDGHIIPPEGTYNGVSALEEGVDYDLVRDTVRQDDYGAELYDRLSFTDNQLFENNSTIYVTYVYYDSDKKTGITNFSPGSVASMLARAMSTQLYNLYSQNERLYNAGSVATATGSDLINHGEIWGVELDEGSPASGTVLVTVDSSGSDLTVNTSMAFVSNLAGENLIFNATTGGTVSAGTSQEFTVQSVENGYKYNVGSNSITRLYTSNDLSAEITGDTVSVVNNALRLDATPNVFSGGTDRQTDQDYRDAIYLQANKVGRGTLEAIKSAIEDLDNVSSARVKDWSTNKDISNGLFYIQAVGNTGFKLLTDTASITKIKEVVDEYRPAGQTYGLQHPMAVMIDFSGTATIEDDQYLNKDTIVSSITTKIQDYINNLKIGEDVLYSEIVSEAMAVGGVYDFRIDKFNHTEFTTNPLSLDKTTHLISDNSDGSGTSYRTFYQEFKFMQTGRVETVIYSGNSTFNTSYSPVADSPTPAVYLSVDDGTGNYIKDPAYALDWYTSNGTSTIVIEPLTGSGVNRYLASGVDRLNLYYETLDNDTIDGVRVKLHGAFSSGTTSGTVKLEVWSGVSSPAGGTLLESGTIVVLSGTYDYEVIFSSPLTVGDASTTYYVVLSGTSTLGSGSYISLPTSNSGTLGSQNTSLYSGSTGDLGSGTMGRVLNSVGMLHTMIINSGVTNIEIEGDADIPDVAVVYSVDIGSTIRV